MKEPGGPGPRPLQGFRSPVPVQVLSPSRTGAHTALGEDTLGRNFTEKNSFLASNRRCLDEVDLLMVKPLLQEKNKKKSLVHYTELFYIQILPQKEMSFICTLFSLS